MIKFEDGWSDIANHYKFKAKTLGVITTGLSSQNARGVWKVFKNTTNDGVLNRGNDFIRRVRVKKQFGDSGSAFK